MNDFKEFEVEQLEVGGNFIQIKIKDYQEHRLLKVEFYQMPRDLIKKTLAIYGITLTEEELKDYDEL